MDSIKNEENGYSAVRVGTQTRDMIAGPHRHTSEGIIAESLLTPLSDSQADVLDAITRSTETGEEARLRGDDPEAAELARRCEASRRGTRGHVVRNWPVVGRVRLPAEQRPGYPVHVESEVAS